MNGSAQRAVKQFALTLADLRRAAGSPPFQTIEVLSKDRRLPRSTAADAVKGDHLPSLPVVYMFVDACREFARHHRIAVKDEDFDHVVWQSGGQK
jgi:hypothetical protein